MSIELLNKFIDTHSRKLGYLSLGLSAYYTLKALSKVTKAIVNNLMPSHNLIERYGRGSYALITACTDGIGKGFALELARRGFNLVMLVRNVEKAEALAAEIKKDVNPDIQVHITKIDFLASMELKVVNDVYEDIKHLDISLVVNNAGMAIKTLPFEIIQQQELLDILSMNIGSAVLLTHKLITQLRQRKNGRSGIVNLSSQSTQWGVPGFVMYGATKCFNAYFSEALHAEYKNEIDILCVKPGWVNTPMTQGFKKVLEITPEECARASLDVLGRTMTTSGHWKHKLSWKLQGLKQGAIDAKLNALTKQIREAALPASTFI